MSSSAAQRCGACSACTDFSAQFYRPALCLCYHPISDHFPAGVWQQEKDATGKVFYVSKTGERLFARPADVSISSAAAAARVRELALERQREAGAGS